MQARSNCVWATAVLICVASARGQVTIETVTVGSIGNIPELTGEDAIIGGNALGNGPNRLAGTVNYLYEIGKYEVTAGQYTEFLNAVAVEDGDVPRVVKTVRGSFHLRNGLVFVNR